MREGVKTTGSFIVSWDFSEGTLNGVLLVGSKKPGKPVEIVNAFRGKDAIDIYNKLKNVKKEK